MTTISLPEFTEYFHQRLLLAAEQWLSALRAIADEPLLPEAMLEQLVLPMQSVTDRLLSLSALNSAFPAVLRDIADAHVQQQARDYLSRVAAELLGSSERLRQTLSDISLELASRRTLLGPRDRMDVGPASVLAAAAMVNLMYVFDKMRRHSGRSASEEALESIQDWVALAVSPDRAVRPGDLWILDLFARTLRVALQKLPKQATKATSSAEPISQVATIEDLLEHVAPAFTSASLLNKLLEVQHYPVALAQLSHFRSLPGLELLVVDPGCNAARHVLIGGIARIAGDTDDTRIRGALARLLEALVTFDTQPLRIHAQIMIASLFWELLEYNENALSNMLVGQAQIKALQRATHAIEAGRRDSLDDQWQSQQRRLQEIARCLDTYPSYAALVALQAKLRAHEPGPTSPAAASSNGTQAHAAQRASTTASKAARKAAHKTTQKANGTPAEQSTVAQHTRNTTSNQGERTTRL